MRLLLLEDDATLGSGLRAYLQAHGHAVEWCDRLSTARLLRSEPFDAMLVDWQLPDGSGVEWVRQLRSEGLTLPIIILTARDLLRDRVVGLDAGADDYLVKPFDPDELLARLRAMQRRATADLQNWLKFGDVELDLTAHRVRRAGQRVELTAREWSIVEALAMRMGRLVAKSDLEALATGLEGELSSNALEVHVSAIRRKLGRKFIDTVRGMGYRMGT